MFNFIATIASLSLVLKAETDSQKVIGGAFLAAALNSSFRAIERT